MGVELGSDGDRSESTRAATGGKTVAAVDEIDGQPHLVVADIECDDAWVAVEEPAAVAVAAWE